MVLRSSLCYVVNVHHQPLLWLYSAHVVRVLGTIGAEGMHNWCGGHAPYLGMVKEKDLVNKFLVDE